MDANTWLWLKIYTQTQVFAGCAYYPHHNRLLDLLNGAFPGTLEGQAEYLALSEVTMHWLGGRDENVATAFVNKANVLMVRRLDEKAAVSDRAVTHRAYPFVEKLAVAVRVCLPPYTLSGLMHCARGERVWDVLNKGPRFLPVTDVELSAAGSEREPGICFVAVNKEHIVSVEETGSPLLEARRIVDKNTTAKEM